MDPLFKKKFAGMAVGNIMEWFDFAAFGAFADIIGDEFFPSENKSMQLIQSMAVFGAAFVMRPLGGILMGWIGDTVGRQRALELSIALMLLPSFLIGCLPTYYQIGWTATALLVFLRLLQGLAVGGELVGAFIYTIEATNGKSRGFWGGACKGTGNLGTTLGMGMAALLRSCLSSKQLKVWGWRVPFLLGIVFGTIGLLLRRSLPKEEMISDNNGSNNIDSNDNNDNNTKKNPIRVVFRDAYRELISVLLVAAFWGCGYYTSFVWMVYFLTDSNLIGKDNDKVKDFAWTIIFMMNVLLVVWLPIGGYIGDQIGKYIKDEEEGFKVTLRLALIISLLVSIPAFILITSRTLLGVILGELLFVIPIGLFGSNLPAFMVSQFPLLLRYTGVGISYNIANALFGGTAPLIQSSLVLSSSLTNKSSGFSFELNDLLTDSRLRPAYYIMTVSLMSYLVLLYGTTKTNDNNKQYIPTSIECDEESDAVDVQLISLKI